jgi:hypothetical protein
MNFTLPPDSPYEIVYTDFYSFVIPKLRRKSDGCIAVLHTYRFSCGWSTAATRRHGPGIGMMHAHDPETVINVLNGNIEAIQSTNYEERYGVDYIGVVPAPSLKVVWVPEGAAFGIVVINNGDEVVLQESMMDMVA